MNYQEKAHQRPKGQLKGANDRHAQRRRHVESTHQHSQGISSSSQSSSHHRLDTLGTRAERASNHNIKRKFQ